MFRIRGLIIVGMVHLILGCPAVGQWKTFTSKRSIRALAGDSSALWAATGGGVFFYKFSNGMFKEFSTADGLHTINLSAVAVDGFGHVWFGAENGFIHRYTPATGEWQYVTDIAQIQNPQKAINRLIVSGDSLIILSDLGVSIFSISSMQFSDTYTRFGPDTNQLSGSVVDLAFFQGKICVATRSGIAMIQTTNTLQQDPRSWQVFNHLQGLPSDNVTALAALGDTLYAGTSAGVVRYDGTGWTTLPVTSGLNILDMSIYPAGICSSCGGLTPPFLVCIATDRIVFLDPATNQTNITSGFASPLTCLMRGTGGIAGTASTGIVTGLQNPSYIYPQGPVTNSFFGVAVDNRGVLWSGTGAVNGAGFMSFDGAVWKSYSVAGDARLGTDNYYKVSIGANDCKWISNFGTGIALVDDQGTVRKVLTASDGLPSSVPNSPNFVVVGGVATSPDGTTWLTNRTPAPDTNLVLFLPDSSLGYVVGCGPGCSMRDPTNVLTDVAIDQNDTKWFANYNQLEPVIANRAVGFFFYNEKFTLPGTSEGWGSLTTDDGLTSSQVWSVAVDPDNAVWIGTDQGISILFDPSNPHANVAVYHPLNDQVVTAIVPDALNNKWIGTLRNGAFELSADGTEILAHYTVESTDGKLLDDDITSIAIDSRSGTVYFGTSAGLSALKTAAVRPNEEFGELAFSPDPFYPGPQKQLLVDGLVGGSSLKILRIDGTLVRDVSTPGGRIGYWDGTDNQGKIVPTGVYIIVAYSEDGSSLATGKVAVIRR